MTHHTLRDRIAFQRAQEEYQRINAGDRMSFQRYLEKAYAELTENPPPELLEVDKPNGI